MTLFRSRLISAASKIMHTAYEPEGNSTLTLLSDAEKSTAEIAEGNRQDSGPQHVKGLFKTTVTELREIAQNPGGLTGVPTGFTDIDKRTSGLQKRSEERRVGKECRSRWSTDH